MKNQTNSQKSMELKYSVKSLRNRLETQTVAPFGHPVNDMPVSRHSPAQPSRPNKPTSELANQTQQAQQAQLASHPTPSKPASQSAIQNRAKPLCKKLGHPKIQALEFATNASVFTRPALPSAKNLDIIASNHRPIECWRGWRQRW